MKFLATRILITVLTFTLGVVGFSIGSQINIVIQTQMMQTEALQLANSNVADVTEANSNREKFTLLGHACGNGWTQGYELPDGQRISTGVDAFGSSKKAQSELSKTLFESERIITIVEQYKKPSGEIGKRTIAEFISEKTGQNVIGIFWRKDGKNSYEYIYAPSLEVALEFEKYQESEWK